MLNKNGKLNIAYLATPDFSIPTLEILQHHPQVNLVKVISLLSKPAGRGHQLRPPAIIEYAKGQKISFFQTEKINQEEALINELADNKIDIILVLAFSQFLSSRLLTLPRIGAFNIHTSLLPKYRGASPIQHAILYGENQTGVTIQKMVKKMDAGDVAHIETLEITPVDTSASLATKLKFSAAMATSIFIDKVIDNKLSLTPQDESKVSYAPLLKREDGFLDFKTSTFSKIHNTVRAFYPWPGTYCFLNKMRLKVLQISSVPYNGTLLPGSVDTSSGKLLVGLLDGVARLEFVQLPGKKPSADTDLLNGFRNEVFLTKSLPLN